MPDFEAHITRQIVWSRATFGPGRRDEGVSDHIKKKLVEIENENGRADKFREWADVAILGIDGLWRSFESMFAPGSMTADEIAGEVVKIILRKQAINENREWPDWRTAVQNKTIEHVRGDGA